MRDAFAIAVLALALWPRAAAAQEEAPAAGIKRYTFAEALERAQARNPSAAQAQQEILRAEALVRQAAASSLPTLTGNATGQRIDHERTIADRVIQNAESLSGNVALAVPLFSAQRWMQWVSPGGGVGEMTGSWTLTSKPSLTTWIKVYFCER